ncbi:MAG TPA: hypothetical protein V6D17_03515 [Candidatus Obscuribacterales bacterium]
MTSTNSVPTPNPVPFGDKTPSASPQAEDLKALFQGDSAELDLARTKQSSPFSGDTAELEKDQKRATANRERGLDELAASKETATLAEDTANIPNKADATAADSPVVRIDLSAREIAEALAGDSEAVPPPQVKEQEEAEPTRLAKTDNQVMLSRTELVSILENFVNLIKTEVLPNANSLDFTPDESNARIAEVTVDDRTQEIDELRSLLIEAQDTIIQLLTDRVEDRAKIAHLEAQIRLLPDLQQQADRANRNAVEAEDFRCELAKVKSELERLRIAKVREESEMIKRSWWSGLTDWLKGKQA